MTRFGFVLYVHCFLISIGVSSAFHTQSLNRQQEQRTVLVLQRRSSTTRLFSEPKYYNYNNNGDDTDDITKYTFDLPMSGFWEDTDLHGQLKDRRMKIHDGVGRRYIVRTRETGNLNVHLEPSSASATDNVVNQLTDGQIVRSTGPTRGIWIPHDGGGWSVSDHQGFTWLEPIDE
ncbi:unnamed protein product [Cylindrotheca closterium]|uniref:Uncharacterized protein n=1 Tax=Cylindrotheca closterium TaxID=2856 RepID=A0AAD2FV52_9STRA|nr:unnamed protein product [Cylindrotheca closterium]